jgi:transcriptional regulator with XRE-family HTH domain
MSINKFKENIRVERKKRKKSVSYICARLEVNRFWIAHLTNPSLNTIINLANAIGCTPADLMKDI